MARRALAKQTIKQRKALRSKAGKPRDLTWSDISGIPDILRGAPPKPSLWQRIKGWVLRAA